LSTSDSKRYTLSALLDADSFFYALFDPVDHKVSKRGMMVLDSGLDDLSDASIDRSKSKVAVWTDHMTIVPKDDFDASQIKMYLDGDGTLDSLALTYMSDYMAGTEAYICYGVPTSDLQKLSAYTSTSKVSHLIKSLYQSLTSTYTSVIHLHGQDQKTLLLAVKEGKLMAFHVSTSPSPVSTLYNISLVTERHTHMKDCIIGLSGDFSEHGKTSRLLSKYYPTEFLGSNYHLESIYRCES